MKGPLSLAEELRALRGGVNSGAAVKRPPEPATTPERPWMGDIERVQQTLREVLQAVSHFSGVELQDTAPDAQNGGDGPSRLDCATLKDRIRNDLEAFSVTAVSKLARQAEEQARAALAAVQEDMRGQVEQAAGELREKLQGQLGSEQIESDYSKQSRDRVAELVQTQTDEFARWVWLMCKGTGTPIPVQIEKLLEPYVEEATARLTGTIEQRARELLARQEQLIQDKLQVAVGSFEAQVKALEEAGQLICEQNADAVTKLSADRLDSAVDEAIGKLDGRIQERIEASLGGYQARLEEAAAALRERWQKEEDLKVQGFIHRVEAVTSEAEETKLAEISVRIQQAATGVMESSIQHLNQQAQEAGDHSKEQLKAFLEQEVEDIRGRIQEVGRSTQESVSQDAERVADRLRGLDQEIGGIRERYLADSQEKLSAMVQESVASLEPRIRQMADAKLGESYADVRKSQDEMALQFESRLREVAEGQYRNLQERLQKELGDAGASAAAEVKNVSSSVMQELSDKVNISASLLKEQQEQASSRFEASVGQSLELYRQQLVRITEAGLEEHRKSISGSITDLQNRLRQAAELLHPPIPTAP